MIGLIAGGLAIDAELGPWPPLLTDWLDSATTTELRLSSGAESERADRLLEDRLRGPKPISEIVIVQSDSHTVDDSRVQAKTEAVYADILSLGSETVASGANYYQTNSRPSSPRTAELR